MIYANPESDKQYVIDTCNLHAKQARWRPRECLQGKTKHEVITEMINVGFKYVRGKSGGMMFVTLPQ